MCGVAGIFGIEPCRPEMLQSMTQRLAHRGPDAGATWISPNLSVGLGHRRLSIIDLSAAANQPFHSADGRFTLVFNGEIYNYRELANTLREAAITLRTQSDTEVLLEGYIFYGLSWISRLEGMFAFAIYDSQKNEMLLVRDRLGKKPLFVSRQRNFICFGSELKSLIPALENRTLSPLAIQRFLHLGYIPGELSIWNEVRKFPAGHYAIIKPDLNIKPEPYWSLEAEASGYHDYRDPLKEFQYLMERSVNLRLIADVPVGSFLSGGTDSSLVTAVASKLSGSPLKTFSIGFRESAFNELKYAEEVAQLLGTDHESFTLEQSSALELLDTYTRHFDEPFADTSSIPMLLVSGLAKKKVKVVLTGDGGDELFLGYGSYTWANRLYSPYWRLAASVMAPAFKTLGNSRFRRVAELLKLPAIPELPAHIFSQENYFFSAAEIQNHLCPGKPYEPFTFDVTRYTNLGYSYAFAQSMFDLMNYLREDLLSKVDRTTMYHGIEARCPLLDNNLVTWSLGLNEKWKSDARIKKILPKQLLSAYLPAELIHRKKWGFSVPLNLWLRHELSDLYHQYTDADLIREANLVDADYVQQLKSRFNKGDDYLYNRIWTVIVLHKWWKENLA